MQLREQEKNLQAYLNNMPYEFRHPVYEHLCQFIRQNEYFWLRSSVQRNNFDQFFSFIEAVGFINIGKNMIQIRAMIPHNYPMAIPQFDLVYHSESYDIVNHGKLASSSLISIRKNQANQQLIRLNFPSLNQLWLHQQARNICNAFTQVQREVNHPPLLVTKERQHNQAMLKSMRFTGNARKDKMNGLTQGLLNQLEDSIIGVQDYMGQVQIIKQNSQYKEARVDFLARNSVKLEKSMQAQQAKINQALNQVRSKHEEILLKDTFDPILSMTPQDSAKVEAIASQESLKEVERNLVRCLQKNLSDGGRFQDHKGTMRVFYEQMFESQLAFLKICE